MYGQPDKNSKRVQVRNRSNRVVIYRVEDMGVRREFQPGEVKMIPQEELYALSQKQGGLYILANSLYISDPATVEEMPMKVEPEYYLDDKGVIELITNGSVDAFLDCLDFAPAGVIDLVKKYAVELPLTDTRKIKAMEEKLGFKLEKVLQHIEEVKKEEEEMANETDSGMKIIETPGRRVKTEPKEETTERRTAPQYKVVTKKEE